MGRSVSPEATAFSVTDSTLETALRVSLAAPTWLAEAQVVDRSRHFCSLKQVRKADSLEERQQMRLYREFVEMGNLKQMHDHVAAAAVQEVARSQRCHPATPPHLEKVRYQAAFVL